MRILVIGSKGQLGTDLVGVLGGAGHDIIGVDVPQIDITDAAKTLAVVTDARPQVIVNPAAYTAVDACETNAETAFRINGEGARNVAVAAKAVDALLVHISTDYVFDGTGTVPYVETDRPNPMSVYGKSKLLGEELVARSWERHIILRIAWLYGRHGANFVKTILKIARTQGAAGKPLRVVNDQDGSPTHTIDVCRQVGALLSSTEYGVYHSTSEGECSWFEFTRYLLEKYRVDVDLQPCTTAEFPRPAPRPAYSVLENARLKALRCNLMPTWERAFDEFFAANPNPTV